MTVAENSDALSPDVLMAAVTGEALPQDAHDDAGLVAEYEAAVADVRVLREQLRVVGDGLAGGPAKSGHPAGPVAPGRSVRPGTSGSSRPSGSSSAARRAFLALAAVLACVLVGGLGLLMARSGTGTGGDDADAAKSDGKAAAPRSPGHDSGAENGGQNEKRSPEGYVACARLIVEGTVTRVEPLPGGVRDRITLDVARYYKPDKGARKVTFEMEVNVDPRLRPGDRTLIGIPRGQRAPDIRSTGKDIATTRLWVERALPGARGGGDSCG
ncbi:hypothetical protein [Streptomyces sp. NPDC059009]|uniref:hypothetical protein n=1 Tax=Streptomyces sp. NPDC059009 TaxID=3346694 RepID=UPI00368E04FD